MKLAPKSSHLAIDPAAFAASFTKKPFAIAHSLASHPLFELERLVVLSRKLPAELVEYNAGDVPIGLDPKKTPRTGLSVEETIRRIHECGSWLVLKNVERDPEYGELLHECVGELAPHAEAIDPGVKSREGFVFVSSPRAVTPYHMDPEHNFLLQVRGMKAITVFDGTDRGILSEEELEKFYAGGGRNLRWRECLHGLGDTIPLGPGDGLHVPITFPHWVKNGPEVSVSFSVTWRTPASEQRDVLYKVNAKLRGAGFDPSTVGESTKLAAVRAFRKLKRVIPRPRE